MTASYERDTPLSPTEWETLERFDMHRPERGVLHLEDVLPVLPVGWTWELDRTADIVRVEIRTPSGELPYTEVLVIGPGIRETLALAAFTAVWKVEVWWRAENVIQRILDKLADALAVLIARLDAWDTRRHESRARRYASLEEEMTGRFDWCGRPIEQER